jgi:hypothetical protein
MRTGQVNIKGPMTKEDQVEWDRMYARIEECDREIASSMNCRYRWFLRSLRLAVISDIAHEKRIRQIIVDAVGEPKRRNPGGR